MNVSRRAFVINSTLAMGAATLEAESGSAPAPYGAIPSASQLQWQRMETCAFLHFTVNTFTDKEWGYGDEDPSIFNPTDFDADAIVLALKEGGIKGVILTCKHHDGFCLWPTQATEHCIRNSTWLGGKGDVVRDISQAAARHGLKFGVYLSPWDRNNPNYGKPEYLQIYRQQLTELLSNYGPIFEVWFDGANGGDGFYGGAREKRTIDKSTYYDWQKTWEIVRRLQPQAVIESDAGPDIRWVGNESGFAAETSWATFNPVAAQGGPGVPGDVRFKESPGGTRNGSRWLPAECDVSIRPGWFWHEKENGQVKTPKQLVDLYYKSVGRGANLLLNVPPDRRGRLGDADVSSLKSFHQSLDQTFSRNLMAGAGLKASNVRANSRSYRVQNVLDGDPNTYWASDDAVPTPELIVDLRSQQTFNVIRLGEAIQLGQRIEAFTIDTWKEGAWLQIAKGTSIGSCRLIRLAEPVEATRLRLSVTASPVCIALAEFGLYTEPR